MADTPFADLSNTIKMLRSELTKAMADGNDEQLLFGLGPIDLELHMEITNDIAGGGGIKFNILTLGVSKSHGDSNTHKITLRLNPVDAKGKPAHIAAYGKPEIPDS
jgi:hypothetical protein